MAKKMVQKVTVQISQDNILWTLSHL